MERKEEVDLVLLQVMPEGNAGVEAIAIKDGYVIDLGSIPFIFSQYKGENVFHGQGNKLIPIQNGSAIAKTTPFNAQLIDHAGQRIAEWKGSTQTFFNQDLLDPHWDDH